MSGIVLPGAGEAVHTREMVDPDDAVTRKTQSVGIGGGRLENFLAVNHLGGLPAMEMLAIVVGAPLGVTVGAYAAGDQVGDAMTIGAGSAFSSAAADARTALMIRQAQVVDMDGQLDGANLELWVAHAGGAAEVTTGDNDPWVMPGPTGGCQILSGWTTFEDSTGARRHVLNGLAVPFLIAAPTFALALVTQAPLTGFSGTTDRVSCGLWCSMTAWGAWDAA